MLVGLHHSTAHRAVSVCEDCGPLSYLLPKLVTIFPSFPDPWTSVGRIGKAFNGGLFTEEYFASLSKRGIAVDAQKPNSTWAVQ